MRKLLPLTDYRVIVEQMSAAEVDRVIGIETDPEAREMLLRAKPAIVRRMTELSCAVHSGRLMAAREAREERAARTARRRRRIH